eukprot:226874_1
MSEQSNNEIPTQQIETIVKSLYHIEKNEKIFLGWVCLRSSIWTRLPLDLITYTSSFLSSGPKLILFMDKQINIQLTNKEITSKQCNEFLWSTLLHIFFKNLSEYGSSFSCVQYKNKIYENLNVYDSTEYDSGAEYDLKDCPHYRCKPCWTIKPDDPYQVKYLWGNPENRTGLGKGLGKGVTMGYQIGLGKGLVTMGYRKRFKNRNQLKCPPDMSLTGDSWWFYSEQKKEMEEYSKDGMLEAVFNKMRNLFCSFPIKDIFIQSQYERDGVIKVVNPYGINSDYRGADHCEIYLHCFTEQIFEKTKPVSFGDLRLAFWRSKSHKFENWYELYGGASVRWDEQEAKCLIINIFFDHGS